ncbi:sensor histidine kinase [Clostridiaceae bacterium M8S5]|nr:sensor histidine kinase [Clostridiaceae bacterium M8S5]
MDTNSKNEVETNNSTDIKEKPDLSKDNIVEVGEEKDEHKVKEEDNNQIEPIKKEETQKRFKILNSSIVLFLYIALISTVIAFSYAPVKKWYGYENIEQKYIQSRLFSNNMFRYTEYLLNSTDEYYPNINLEVQPYADAKSLKYLVRFDDEVKVLSNDKHEWFNLENANTLYYIRIQCDDKGKFTIEELNDKKFESSILLSRLNEWNKNRKQGPFKNVRVQYLIPKNLSQYDDELVTEISRYSVEYALIWIIAIISVIGAIIVILSALLADYKNQKERKILRLYNIMPLEFKIAIVVGVAAFCIAFGNNILYNLEDQIITAICLANDNFHIIGITALFIIYMWIYKNIVYVKYIYHKGIVEGLIKNSIAGLILLRVGRVLIRICKALGVICGRMFVALRNKFRKFSNMELSKKYYILLGLIILINIILLIFCASVYKNDLTLLVFGLYELLVVVLLTVIFLKTKKLETDTNSLSQGKFNIEYNSEKGIYSSIYNNLNNINKGFKVAVEDATKSQQMKAELITNVSHDLKTPLTSIITYVDLLKSDEVDSKSKREYIDILDKKSKRLQILIEDLFEASKASSGSVEMFFEDIDIIALFRQTIGELEERIEKSSLNFKINLPNEKIICRLDGKRTYRIFENIMSNIFKYSMENSRVYIDLKESSSDVMFIFRNIAAYEMNFDEQEIIERFTRGDKSRNTEGSGLGLAITKSLMSLQDGLMDIKIDGDLFKLSLIFKKSTKMAVENNIN